MISAIHLKYMIELGGRGHGVQPLRAVYQPEELAWAHGWIVKALRTRGRYEVKAHTEAAITAGLGHVADLPPDRRTLTSLHGFLAGDDAARKALQVYLDGQGPYGRLFDGVLASYGDAPVMGIETQDVMQLEAAAPLVISAMFRAVQRQRLTGDEPKLVVMVDEAWSLLQSDLFGREIEGWAREMRKLKAALVLVDEELGRSRRWPDAGDLRPARQPGLAARCRGAAAADPRALRARGSARGADPVLLAVAACQGRVT